MQRNKEKSKQKINNLIYGMVASDERHPLNNAFIKSLWEEEQENFLKKICFNEQVHECITSRIFFMFLTT